MSAERNAEIVRLYRTGHTLQLIGDRYGITRERVRQILARSGVRADDGGASFVARAKRAERESIRNRKCKARWGMSLHDWQAHVAAYGSTSDRGSPLDRYAIQRKAAHTRKIGWEITFRDWWAIWQDSGKWAERGRGQGYCMARRGDTGPYATDNVYICRSAQNSADYYTFGNNREIHRQLVAIGTRAAREARDPA